MGAGQEQVAAAERIALLVRSFEAYDRGDWEGALEIAAPEVEWINDPELPGGRTWHGKQGILDLWRFWDDSWAEARLEVEGIFPAGDDKLIVHLHFSGQGPSSGAPIDYRYASLYTFRGNLVTRVRGYLDRDEAARAAGL